MTAGRDGGYDGQATARWAAEPRKQSGGSGRGPFVRDRARVLHSAALRRLAGKTQVVAAGSGDFPRTRLTHSLECAQIGRELGAALGCDADLVDAACLAHDLGHPPFGHNGEAALAELAAGCGGFEGNAQSLRLLTRLEAKVPGAGLNLTRATLDATLKYPRPGPSRLAGGEPPPAVGDLPAAASASRKYGAYADDAEVFTWIRAVAPDGRTCLEAQVMDWADDVAYSVHDLEDGLHAGLVSFGVLRDRSERDVVTELTVAAYCPLGYATQDELAEVFAHLLELECWPEQFDGSPSASAAVKSLTSELIGRFCGAAELATRPPGHPPVRRYDADLAVPRRQRLECALLKGVTAHYVMLHSGMLATQAREREIIAELGEAIAKGAPATLDPVFRPAFECAADDAARQRVVIDQIASLTDTSAVAWHERLWVAGR
ncbi:MAG TPA: deoxyguanosinetriphosphate triphosphohydrolase [Streptosporangiaceae bacterium]|nr:deoxyguanosinetriphosphate triphosphohydrolase [Streptosporangiaceae bacterium]